MIVMKTQLVYLNKFWCKLTHNYWPVYKFVIKFNYLNMNIINTMFSRKYNRVFKCLKYFNKVVIWSSSALHVVIKTDERENPRFHWSCLSEVMKDATPLTTTSAWAELFKNVNNT